MGKKRAGKDRAYLTNTEWREEHGGYKGDRRGPSFKRLPFTHCAISFQPFEDAVCTADGTCMDIVNAVPYIQKFKKHPVTGAPLALADLIGALHMGLLNFHKNAAGEYECPVLNKVFTEHTHIVAVKPTGNVYCWEAVDELCLKPKNMRDLLTDEPFTRKDIIHLQDPLNLAGRNLAEFDHVKKGLHADEEERAAEEADPMFYIRGATEDTKRALEALNSKEAAAAFAAGGGGKKAQAERLLADAKAAAASKPGVGGAAAGKPAAAAAAAAGGSDPRLRSAPRQELKASFRPGAATWNTDEPGAPGTAPMPAQKKEDLSAGRKVPPPYSIKTEQAFTTTGAASRAFTSTAMAPQTRNERTIRVIQLEPKTKGYVRLHTNLGDLNLELHCDICPRTCENFMALAEGGYYNDTPFHRSIKNFMIQGGDPTGTGRGGESVFGEKFKDELDSRLTHNGRGILSMANSGKDTNGSQFFMLYKSAHHLDYKHTVFGRVVGGFDVLTLMEKVPTDDDDRPLQEIKITGATVFVNPYKELLEEEAKKEEAKRKAAEKQEQGFTNDDEFGAWFSNPAGAGGSGSGSAGGVGRYLSAAPAVGAGALAKGAAGTAGAAGAAAQPAAKKAKTAADYGNFDAW